MRSIAAYSAVLALTLHGAYLYAFAPTVSWSFPDLVYCSLAYLSFFLPIFTPLYLITGRRLERAVWIALPAVLILCAAVDAGCYRLFKTHLDRFIVTNTVYALWTREVDPFNVPLAHVAGLFLGLFLLVAVTGVAALLTERWRLQARRSRAVDVTLILLWAVFLFQGAAIPALKQHGFYAWGIFPFEKTNLAETWSPPGKGPAFTSETEFSQLAKLQIPRNIKAKRRPNIILLHAESLRGDVLTPENMPLLAARTARCEKDGRCRVLRGHYSTGNNSSMGVFGILTGLNGFYYFPSKRAQSPPLPLAALQKLGYRGSLYTISDMRYDGMQEHLFDPTFSHVYPPLKGESHNIHMEKLDQKMLQTYFDDLGETDFAAGPRLDYVLSYLTHFNYYYSPRCAKHSPVLELPFQLASGSFSRLNAYYAELRNRYLNAACETDHVVDSIIRRLQEIGQWENTILVVFGDHGEEFGEKGRLGHSFGHNDEQVRTAFVVFFPTPVPKIAYTVTSHADVMSTLFDYMGVAGGPSFMNGKELFDYDPVRDFAIVADGSFGRQMRYRYSIVSPEMKVTFPNYGPLDPDRTAVYDRADIRKLDFDRGDAADLLRKALESKSDFREQK